MTATLPHQSGREAGGLIVRAIDLHAIAVTAKSNWTFLRIETEACAGWGEVTLRSHEGAMRAVLASMEDQIVGRRLETLDEFRQAYPSIPSGRVGNALLSGIDQALSDIEARVRGLPLHRALGGAEARPLPGYATVNRSIKKRTPEGFAEGTRRAVEAGFGAVKVMPFDAVLPASARTAEGRNEIRRAIERIEAVCAAVRGRAEVMVDCHWRLDEATAGDLIGEAARLGLAWVECPIPESPSWFDAIARLRRLAGRKGVRLAGAENVVGAAGFAPFIEGGLYDVVMPDIKYCGGHREMARICEMGRAAGIAVSPHNPSGPVAHAHTLHSCLALDLREPVEQQFDESPLFEESIFGEAPTLRAGHFSVTDAPGLGLAPDGGVLRRHPMQPIPLGLSDPSFA